MLRFLLVKNLIFPAFSKKTNWKNRNLPFYPFKRVAKTFHIYQINRYVISPEPPNN